MSRLRDPIHFFDSRGKSVLNQDHLEKQVDELTLEVQRLKRLLRTAVRKLKAQGDSASDGEIAN